MTRTGGLEAIVSNPEWLPHAFNPEGSNLSFVQVTREMHRSLPFVDEQQLRDQPSWAVLPTEALLDQLPTIDTAPVHFLFHTAFCCSTLLANALEATGTVVGMKEPAIFVSLMQSLERGEDLAQSRRLELAMRLLARRFDGTQATVLKPTCFASPLMPHLLAAVPNARAVLLHSDLRSFLYAVAKRGLRGRIWGRQAFASAMKHFPLNLGYGAVQTWEQTDLQIAGLAWLMRRSYFNAMAARWGSRRVRQLDGEEVARDPYKTLETVSGYFGLSADTRALRTVSAGPVLHRHSKEGRPFGRRERDIERKNLEARYEEEVEAVARWVETIAEQRGIGVAGEVPDMRLAG